MQLYTNAISYSKSLIDTTGYNRGRIFNNYASTKILFFQNSEPWIRKDGNKGFDAPMECYL